MMNLFDYAQENASEKQGQTNEGLRLQTLEVYNWGTFHKQIWSFTPQGATTLLTGDSGSGKSTLVDALLTLFVSPRKIAYNKAADATAKERSMNSYVRGYYGQKYAYEGKGKPEALRDETQYSVLLATLQDVELDKTVTLAVFFWFREQQTMPQHFYVVTQKPLSIVRDFSGFHGNVKQLRATLKENECEVFDDYPKYGVCYQKALGGLRPQAIDLFQQTISMKKVEALTDFVRSNMLEETNIAEEIDHLLQHYNSLNSAFEAVRCARKQTQQLRPICQNGTQHTMQKAALTEVDQARSALEDWFASQKKELYVVRVAQLTADFAAAAETLERKRSAYEKLEQNIMRLNGEIYENGGGALESLRAELARKQEAKTRCCSDLAQYRQYAQQLSLREPDTRDAFLENQQKMKALYDVLPSEKENAQNELTQTSIHLDGEKKKKIEIDDEISSLRGRTSNIPKMLISLRENLCKALSIAPEHLLFAGELLEVKESENAWEGAIERLLHTFALSLLVPEQHYTAVAQWVNEQNLGARLVYYSTKLQPREAHQLPPAAVANKLVIKQQTLFTQWLAQEVSYRFDHVCCTDLSLFRREKHAITMLGQIKSFTRHEKDDRHTLRDTTRYVLGFSNEKKIAALAQQANALAESIKAMMQSYSIAQKRLTSLDLQQNALTGLANFSEFSNLDVQGIQAEIEACNRKIDSLSKAENGILNILREQLQQAKKEKETQKGAVEDTIVKVEGLKNQIDATKAEQNANLAKLEMETAAERGAYAYLTQNKSRWLGTSELTLENSASQEKRYGGSLQNERNKMNDNIQTLEKAIIKDIAYFRREFPNETREMDDAVESLPECQHMLEQLETDALPKYEANFKNLLTSQVINRIASFHMELKSQYKKVKDRIKDINDSLRQIDYNPGRYIRLNCEDSPDSEIKDFRAGLKACTEGASGGFDDEELATARFLQIKEILQRFQGRDKETETDKRWTKKVTDVRNWFVFSASERNGIDDTEYEHYTDSGGKSGGQKEKLAYTILAASLVYNYGLNQDYIDNTSFRLVVIDEAFLKSSDDSAKYGLQLFEQLHFQLVIVTPLLKISTIEPFIAHVGYVSYNDATHQSSLVNIPIKVYKEKRKEWKAQNAAALDG